MKIECKVSGDENVYVVSISANEFKKAQISADDVQAIQVAEETGRVSDKLISLAVLARRIEFTC